MRPVTYILPMIFALVVFGGGPWGRSGEWPNWRGPSANGVAPAGKYPLKWSQDDHIQWKLPLSSRAGSTPIVWHDQIFLTSAVDGQNVVMSVDWQGHQEWQVALGSERAGKHKKGSGCNPSPVTDGQAVYVYFKSGDLAALDMNGNVLWHKNLQLLFGEDTLWWDLGTSPVLTEKYLVVACVQSGPSYFAAFHKGTGEMAWKADRTLPAPEEANQTYSTPVVVKDGERELLIMLGADHVTAHDAADGHELWRVGGLNPAGNKYFRSIASAVVTDGMVVAPYARGETLTGITLEGKQVWQETQLSADVPTPAALTGKAYVCSDKGHVGCIDAATGKVEWTVETGKNRHAFSASPIVSGDRIYVAREDGVVFVIDLLHDHAILATNELAAEILVSTPVLAHDRILLRTSDYLYCVGEN